MQYQVFIRYEITYTIRSFYDTFTLVCIHFYAPLRRFTPPLITRESYVASLVKFRQVLWKEQGDGQTDGRTDRRSDRKTNNALVHPHQAGKSFSKFALFPPSGLGGGSVRADGRTNGRTEK